MAKTDIWPTVGTERETLAADLHSLSDDQWSTRSLCGDWTVRDVLAHMTAVAQISLPGLLPKLISSGFNVNRLQAKDIERFSGRTPSDTLAEFQSIVGARKSPPGPADTVLGETILHAEDIRRPLTIAHQYPPEALVELADFYKGSNLVLGAKRRIAGVHLRATDTSWAHGSGSEVAGPMLSILMVMTGRMAALDDLEGDGVETLRSRS